MSICFERGRSFGLLRKSFVNVYQFVSVIFFPFGFEGGMWDLLVLVPDHFLFDLLLLPKEELTRRNMTKSSWC